MIGRRIAPAVRPRAGRRVADPNDSPPGRLTSRESTKLRNRVIRPSRSEKTCAQSVSTTRPVAFIRWRSRPRTTTLLPLAMYSHGSKISNSACWPNVRKNRATSSRPRWMPA
jgi:hypothetical protein